MQTKPNLFCPEAICDLQDHILFSGQNILNNVKRNMSTENVSNKEKGNGVLADVISRLSDEQIDSIIYDLDEYARDYDSCEYGLPTHGEHIENMRILVKQFLNGL